MRIPELGFHRGVLLFKYVVLNQECCGSSQYNLPDRILRLDANTTLNQSYVQFITLVIITYDSGDQYLSSIRSWNGVYMMVGVTYPTNFNFNSSGSSFNCVPCSACNFQKNILYYFFGAIKVSFFSDLSFCPSFKSLLLLLSLVILSLLLFSS